MGWTNRGKYLISKGYFQTVGSPATFHAALVADVSISPTINTLGQLSEIPAGNGYTSGGIAVSADNIGFPTVTQDDINNKAVLTLKDLVFTASGGNLPSSGTTTFVVLTDDNVTVANRQVIAYWGFASGQVVSDGHSLTLSSFTLDLQDTV